MLSLHRGHFAAAEWHLVLCKPNRNHIAFRHLAALGFDLFMPQHVVERRWRGRVRAERRPVFVGYVFVGTDPERPRWRQIRATPGVSQLVGFGANGPARVPGEIVAGLMQRCDASGLLQPEQDFAAGETVRIVSGPFADFVARIEEVDAERRVHLLLDLLGRKTRIGVDPGCVARRG